MPAITDISPEVLRDRHRLSPHQINLLYGSKVVEDGLEEKAKALEGVAELIRVTDALAAEGISFIPLKGPLLSFRLYGDATFRHFRDLDIMVAPAELDKVLKIISSMGYSAVGRAWPSERQRQQRLIRYHHNIPYANNANGVILEIHWRFRNRQWLDVRQADRLIRQNLNTIDFAGRSYDVLNSEMELLYLIIHGGLHNWGRLKWLVDVQEFLNSRGFDQEKFCTLSESFKAGRLIGLCNMMLSEYFSGGKLLPCANSVPSFVSRLTEKRIMADHYPPPESARTSLENLYFSLRVFPGLLYKFRLISSIIFNRGFGCQAC